MAEVEYEIPKELVDQLAAFGNNLRVARIRRGETQAHFASRLGVHRESLIALEKGSPKVWFGTYAKAMWLLGLSNEIGNLAHPDNDVQGKAAERERDPERVREEQSVQRERHNF